MCCLCFFSYFIILSWYITGTDNSFVCYFCFCVDGNFVSSGILCCVCVKLDSLRLPWPRKLENRMLPNMDIRALLTIPSQRLLSMYVKKMNSRTCVNILWNIRVGGTSHILLLYV